MKVLGAMICTEGEAGTGDVSKAVKHLNKIREVLLSSIRRL